MPGALAAPLSPVRPPPPTQTRPSATPSPPQSDSPCSPLHGAAAGPPPGPAVPSSSPSEAEPLPGAAPSARGTGTGPGPGSGPPAALGRLTGRSPERGSAFEPLGDAARGAGPQRGPTEGGGGAAPNAAADPHGFAVQADGMVVERMATAGRRPPELQNGRLLSTAASAGCQNGTGVQRNGKGVCPGGGDDKGQGLRGFRNVQGTGGPSASSRRATMPCREG